MYLQKTLNASGQHYPCYKIFSNKHFSIQWTALHAACDNDHLEAVKFLIDKGANLNQKTKEGVRIFYI